MLKEILLAVITTITPVAESGVPIDYPPTDNSARKMYEDVRCITDTSSPHYQLLHSPETEYHPDGLITIDGYYAIALGQSFGQVGDRFRITLREEDGSTKEIKAIMCDAKQNCHTRGGAGWHGPDGHIIEAIVYTPALSEEVRITGDANNTEPLNGEILEIKKERRE